MITADILTHRPNVNVFDQATLEVNALGWREPGRYVETEAGDIWVECLMSHGGEILQIRDADTGAIVDPTPAELAKLRDEMRRAVQGEVW